MASGTYYIVSINQTWIDHADLVAENTDAYTNLGAGYVLMFYISALYLLANDMIPTTIGEFWASIFFVVLGSMSLGLLIG